ncbi:MAG: class I SAM-dependent methyltransferase [Flavobacteriaceae bacterium]|nr:class I SAM-dependent methyltransferase [Flavobacteriaceae bacterium]
MSKKITEKKYWESYYKKNHANKEHIISVCSYYDKYWEKLINKNASESKSIIEIGGFPGRYLAYLSSSYNLTPTSLDYNSDVTQIKKSFKIMGVDKYHILQEDFTKYQPKEKYDYVISNGFIEHFENFEEILDTHYKYLKNDGRMLVMIPNMKGFIKQYKYLVDYNNLKVHNLKTMNLKVFKDFALRNNLVIDTLEYFGGFPFNVHQKLTFLQKLIYIPSRFLFKFILNPYLRKKPSKYYSSSIIAIFKK